MSRKYFTLEQANRTLPLIRKIVADITTLYSQWRDLVYQYELVAAQARPERGESQQQIDLRQQIEAVAHRMNGFLGELEEVGCVFKGFEEGLVDFYGQLAGRDVFWCWKQGETKIDHWHELDAGYAGRQPIPDPEGSVA